MRRLNLSLTWTAPIALLALALPVGRLAVAAPMAAAPAAREYAYGSAPLQTLDFYAPAHPGAPLVVFVHGGGWQRGDKANATGEAKLAHLLAQGYAVASIDYRLVPDVRVEDQAADVAAALAWLVREARMLQVDATRMVLMGHSAGAHLAALVGTDPRWLRGAGLSFDRLAGVVLLDGAAYDVPAQRRDGPRIMQRIYAQAFGDDPARQRALSPTEQARSPNAGAFLILHVAREDGARQSAALADALREAGADVTLKGFEGRGLRGHMAINRELGASDYPATPVVDRWLARVLPARR